MLLNFSRIRTRKHDNVAEHFLQWKPERKRLYIGNWYWKGFWRGDL
jgi:hypothetical protein